MLQTVSADTKKTTARGSSKPQPAPDRLLAPPVPGLGNQATLRLMRKCDCGAPDCDCDMGDDRKKKEGDSPRTGLHRAALSPRTPREAPPIVHETLQSTGHTLDPETQAFFETRFGQGLSHVRVHTDSRASESARAVNALAYTVGRDIVFAPGRFAPRANKGRRLLAHELAHVVQQRDATGTLERISDPSDSLEQDADRMANQVMGAPAPASPPVQPFGSAGQPQSRQAADRAPACLTRAPAFAPHGNQASLRRLSATPPRAQPKLEIGAVDDPLEREADRVADQVMRIPDPALEETRFGHDFDGVRIHRDARAAGSARSIGARADTVDDPLEHEADRVADRVTRMPDPRLGMSASPPRIGRKCEECEAEEPEGEGAQTLRAKGARAPSAEGDAPLMVHDVLRSPGQPLDAETRGFFEPRFGADFSAVRVHRDQPAADSARELGARAYAVGNHIVFGPGNFAPRQGEGQILLAHELAHVLQQDGDRDSLRRAGDPNQMPLVLPCPPATSAAPQTDDFLLFPNMGSDLTAAQKKQVADFVDNWKSVGRGQAVRVDGFASKPGEEALNWQLSCSRATNVKAELVTPSLGTPPGIPDGSINLFMQGETDEFGAEAQNRRVTLFVPSAPPPDQPKTPEPQNQPSPPDPDAVPDASCAKNPACPDDYCKPFATRTAARADRDANAAAVLADIDHANRRATPLFRNFVFAPGPAGDISKTFAADFTSAAPTLDATKALVKKLEDALKATPPTFPPGGNSVTLDINSVLGANAITQLVESMMVYSDPLTVPGLIAGGVGKTQVSCKVGQNTDGAVDDSRSASGTVLVTKNADGSLQVTPNISYTLVDTLDFCPGNCGGRFAQTDTVPLSRWEASGVSGDIPFTVRFPAPLLVGAFESEE